MMIWMDFEFDENFGPFLKEISNQVCNGAGVETSIRKDACESEVQGRTSIIQETRREQRSARMVGHNSLAQQSQTGTEAYRQTHATLQPEET